MLYQKAFSIVELIVVIVLLGIVSVVIAPRFLDSNVFNELTLQDGLLAGIRAAQQAALGRANVTFEIDQVDDEWILTTRSSGNPIATLELSADNIALETGSVLSGNTCAAGLDTAVASDFELAFDSHGNLTQFTNGGPPVAVDANFNGVRICVNDDDEFSVCVSPAGYAHAGTCND